MKVSGSPVTAVLERVAAERGEDVADLDPLYDAVDPDALERLFDHGFDGEFTFRYEGCSVTITGDGDLEVEAENAVR